MGQKVNASILSGDAAQEIKGKEGDEMAEESRRLNEFKEYMENLRAKDEFEAIANYANSLFEHDDLSDYEKSWGLYYKALGNTYGRLSTNLSIQIRTARDYLKDAMALNDWEPEFHQLKAAIHFHLGEKNESKQAIQTARGLIDRQHENLSQENLLKLGLRQAETLIMLEDTNSAVEILENILSHNIKAQEGIYDGYIVPKYIATFKDAISTISDNKMRERLEAKEKQILELQQANKAAEKISNPEQITADFKGRISESKSRLEHLREIKETNAKCLVPRIILVVFTSIMIQLFLEPFFLLVDEKAELNSYFYISIITGTILIVSSIFYQMRQANHNERVELHLHEDLQRKLNMMLYVLSVTDNERIILQNKMMEHFDYRGTPEQLANLYERGKSNVKESQFDEMLDLLKRYMSKEDNK